MEFNALIREYSGDTLKVLARVLVADLKDFPDDWKIRYNCQEIDRTTTLLSDLCCGPINPLQIYKPVKESFPITVRTTNGNSIKVQVSPQDTLTILKQKIYQLDQSFPPHVQAYYVKHHYASTLWFDGIPLERCGITPGTTLYLNPKPKSSSKIKYRDDFKPVNLGTTYGRTMDLSNTTPRWAQYSAGVNFCGDCLNHQCPSNRFPGRRFEVTVRASYGELQVIFPRDSKNLLTCPVCCRPLATGQSTSSMEETETHQVALKSLLFSEARAAMFFKFAGSPAIIHKTMDSQRRNALQEFKFLQGSVERLEVTTVEPWRSPYCCMACDTRILLKKEELPFACGHVYHTWCRPAILHRGQCKVCQVKVPTYNSFGDVISNICD